MNSKTTMAFSTMTIAILVLPFASNAILGNQHALAYVFYDLRHCTWIHGGHVRCLSSACNRHDLGYKCVYVVEI